MATKKKIINNVEFDANTPDKVVSILLNYMNSNQRIRIFYGDRKTGRDWCEEWDTMGYVGCSTGKIKIPLLVNNSKSMGGMGINTGSIVRITVNKHDIYRHPKYHIGKIMFKPSAYPELPYGVWINGENHANFKTSEKAQKWAKFISGESNTKA